MHLRMGKPSIAGRRAPARARAWLGALALLAALGACAPTLAASPGAHAGEALAASSPSSPQARRGCAANVLETLGGVLDRVYREGVASERTLAAEHLIAGSAPLREAVEDDNPRAARTAARALLATGHMSNLRILRDGRTLVDLGGPALAPLRGTLAGADGEPIATYLASVWADSSFVDEADGIARGFVALRENGRSIAGSFALARGALAKEGRLTRDHAVLQYTSFPAEAFPSGQLRVYLLRTVSSAAALCGRTREDTLVDTLRQVAELIYAGETGEAALAQVKRVQRNEALLQAVAKREPEATRLAIDKLLTEHIVRLRVSVGGTLLADVGGPYVLAPVQGQLRLHGRPIGSFVLSIQDDEGYLRLARRLAGLDVLMYEDPAHPLLVKDSLGPAFGEVPTSGVYDDDGRVFRVFTLHAQAFPSGPLLIVVLVPIPYPA